MATPLRLPYPPLVLITSDGPICWPDIERLAENRLDLGVSFCLQTRHGHERRGGYFFHIRRTNERFVFRTFDREAVCSFPSGDECAAFVNHVSGRKYDERMWGVAQRVNLRTDPNA